MKNVLEDLPSFFETKCDDSNYIMDREAYIQEMIAQGFRVVEPAPNELFIDLDTEEHYATFQTQLSALHRNGFADLSFRVAPSRNGLPGRHVTITMPFDFRDNYERIAWQAALGSDPMRELLSLVRMTNGDKMPTIFVEAL